MPDLPDNLADLAARRAVGGSLIPPRGSGSGKSLQEMLDGLRQDHLDSMVYVPYASHRILASALGVQCGAQDHSAGRPHQCVSAASHKLAEQGGDPTIHELTAYVCCEHFRAIMGRCIAGG